MKTAYQTKPFKVAYVLYGEAVIFATDEGKAKRKVQEMGSRYLVEKSRNTKHQTIRVLDYTEKLGKGK